MKLSQYRKLSRRLQIEISLSLGISVLIAGLVASVISLSVIIFYHPSAMNWPLFILILGGFEGIALLAALFFLLRAVRREIELEQTKEVFIALASHQLRTHPTAIKNFASMLLGGYAGKLNAKQRKYVELLSSSNESQLRIIEGLLCVAELESNQLKLVPESVEVIALLHEVIVELQPRYDAHHQQLILDTPKELVAVTDRQCLRTAMENLLANASKYTPDGGIIHASISSSEKHVVISVKDNGVGIAKQDLPRLFVKFSRINNPFSIKVAGTGLGLYIIKTIAKLLEGEVRVQSMLGSGSTFTLKIARTLSVNKAITLPAYRE